MRISDWSSDVCSSDLKAFLHSHSYTGNPLACSAALATLDMFEETRAIATNQVISQLMWAQTAELRNLPHVAEVRQQGMVLAIELAKNIRTKEAYPADDSRGLRVYHYSPALGGLPPPMRPWFHFWPLAVLPATKK